MHTHLITYALCYLLACWIGGMVHSVLIMDLVVPPAAWLVLVALVTTMIAQIFFVSWIALARWALGSWVTHRLWWATAVVALILGGFSIPVARGLPELMTTAHWRAVLVIFGYYAILPGLWCWLLAGIMRLLPAPVLLPPPAPLQYPPRPPSL